MSASYDIPPGTRVVAPPRVSWGAIFAGVILVVTIEMVLAILGAGVGLGFVRPTSGGTPDASAFGTGAAVWWLVSTIIALLLGSVAAVRLAGAQTRIDGVLHGLVIWGLTLLFTAYLLTTAVGGLIGGAFSVIGTTVSAATSVVGSGVSAAGSGAKQALPAIEQATGVNPDMLQQQVESVLSSPTPQDPASMSRADAVKAVGQAMPDLLSGGAQTDQAKQRITAIVAAQAHISPQDAQQRLDDALSKLREMKKQAVQAALQTADASAAAVSHASFLAFIAMLIGAVAATVGGALGASRRR
jgi:hypothetical protein